MGGNGTFKGLIHRLTNFHTLTYALYAVASYLMLYWMINTVISLPPDASGNELDSGISAISGLSSLFSIAWTFYLSRLIGKNYDFGTGKGCLSIIISSILMSVVMCACIFIFYSTVLSAIVAAMPPVGT